MISQEEMREGIYMHSSSVNSKGAVLLNSVKKPVYLGNCEDFFDFSPQDKYIRDANNNFEKLLYTDLKNRIESLNGIETLEFYEPTQFFTLESLERECVDAGLFMIDYGKTTFNDHLTTDFGQNHSKCRDRSSSFDQDNIYLILQKKED